MALFSHWRNSNRASLVRGGIYWYRRNFNAGFYVAYCFKSSVVTPRQNLLQILPSNSFFANRCWKPVLPTSVATFYLPFQSSVIHELYGFSPWHSIRYRSNAIVTVDTSDGVARFCVGKPNEIKAIQPKAMKRKKMSRKAKLNELKWYRLKAKKKMKSPNPEVRIRYKLDKAKRKEEWLIEKLRKFEMPKASEPELDPEILTEEERFYLKRTGEKKKNYVPLGRRGVFGGVVLNMHLHWKKHETVKVICKPCRPGQVYEYAKEIARLSKGIVIDIKADNTILFYRERTMCSLRLCHLQILYLKQRLWKSTNLSNH
ncbi:hypothetical protein HPP92_018302 [Vanilla planifolia]|uniref:CRM domain-containing protein n=1 Tax=Vanilla planifolia TaxID=51239 RepID=A0A835QG48_VANPL|nr:hypothetical protein HPP92_018302 [Vanilla planifolia]